MHWYIFEGNARLGPFSAQEIRIKLAAREITEETSVQRVNVPVKRRLKDVIDQLDVESTRNPGTGNTSPSYSPTVVAPPHAAQRSTPMPPPAVPLGGMSQTFQPVPPITAATHDAPRTAAGAPAPAMAPSGKISGSVQQPPTPKANAGREASGGGQNGRPRKMAGSPPPATRIDRAENRTRTLRPSAPPPPPSLLSNWKLWAGVGAAVLILGGVFAARTLSKPAKPTPPPLTLVTSAPAPSQPIVAATLPPAAPPTSAPTLPPPPTAVAEVPLPSDWPKPLLESLNDVMRSRPFTRVSIDGVSLAQIPSQCQPCNTTASFADGSQLRLRSTADEVWLKAQGQQGRKWAVVGMLQKDGQGPWILVQGIEPR